MSIREEFPYFTNNQSVYLDSAATTQKPQCVVDAISNYYSCQNSNVHRSSHSQAKQTTSEYEHARQAVADLINAENAKNIVWTSGATDSLNTICYAFAEQHITKGDNIVVLGSEHHANFIPWQQLAERKNAHFHVVDVNPDGSPNEEHYRKLLNLNPKLVCLQHCSNVLGNIQPIKHLVDLAKAQNSTVVVDGAQAIAHLAVNVTELDCDFYVFSGHKMYAPTGIGVLYYHSRIADKFSPVQFGGEMVQKVTKTGATFRPLPSLLETGTPNISAVIGLSAAISFMKSNQYSVAIKQKQQLFHYLVEQLRQIPNVKLLGDLENNIGIVSFVIEGESVADLAVLLDQFDIAMRFGHHCAMPLISALGVQGTARVSLGIYNTAGDIDRFIDSLTQAIELLDI